MRLVLGVLAPVQGGPYPSFPDTAEPLPMLSAWKTLARQIAGGMVHPSLRYSGISQRKV